MDRDTIIRRIAALDEELKSIKSVVAPAKPRSPVLTRLHGLTRFLLSYWVLLSFAVAVGTAVYVKYAFKIDYFEEYRNQSTRKRISELHRQLADRLLARAEWEAAANGYKEALEINPNNVEATSGLVKAQVFLPEPSEKFPVPEIIDAKLQYLDEQFPKDYIVLFLKGVRSSQIGDYEAAQKSLEQSIDANPLFPGAYLALGYMELGRFDLEGAIKNYRKALDLDPQNPTALNSVGYMYLLSTQYEEAVKYFLRSERTSPQMMTAVDLGFAFRCEGEFDQAANIHEETLKDAERLKTDYERFMWGEWTCNFMPLATNDAQTIKLNIRAYTREQKLALTHFELALDYAAGGRTSSADTEWVEMLRLEDGPAYRAFYVNRIAFLQRILKLSDQANAWLTERRAKLLSR